jgi:hypothetical protein
MEYFTLAWAWVKARFAERSTWDGTVIIGLGVATLVLQTVLPYIAWVAIAYGAWTLLKAES